MLDIENAKGLEDYLSDLLDPNVPSHKKFINELLRRWRPPPKQVEVPNDVQV